MSAAVPDTARDASGPRSTFFLLTAFAIERPWPDLLKTIVTPPKTFP
jgi:hypothetical protein